MIFSISAILKPERWPGGTPDYLKAAIPYCWLGDCDNGPTKSYMVENRDRDGHHARLYDLSFGKRPAEELYDCRKDPGQMVNLAENPAYEEVRAKLEEQLMEQLERTADPRSASIEDFDFDAVPYLGQGPRHPSFNPE